MQFVTSIVGVVIFTGLTAYDTQRLKDIYNNTSQIGPTENIAIFGALTLYMDFINLFLMLLHLMGGGHHHHK